MTPALVPDPLAAGGIEAFGKRLRQGGITARAATERYVSRIRKLDPVLDAFVHVAEQEAVETAAALDRLLESGTDLGPLMGVPVAIKDLFAVTGLPGARAGSNVDVSDCIGVEGDLVRRLKRAGCVILGKTRTVEFAAGAQNLIHPTPWNPLDSRLKLTPGGSSNGSAVAVAAGLCGFAIGTDTGGSVRLPAALCGVFGLKTSHGRWPLDGVFPLCPAMDSAGVLAARSRDAEIVFHALSGTSSAGAAGRGLFGVRFGIPRPESMEELDSAVSRRFEDALRALERHGAGLTEVDWPTPQETQEVDEIFARVVATDLLATLGYTRIEANRSLIDPVALHRLDSAGGVPAADYARLQRRRVQLASTAASRMAGLDAVLTPTSPILPIAVDDVSDVASAVAFVRKSLSLTRPANVYDLCSATLPLGRVPGADNAVGLQLSCARRAETRLLSLAREVEGLLGEPLPNDMRRFLPAAGSDDG